MPFRKSSNPKEWGSSLRPRYSTNRTGPMDMIVPAQIPYRPQQTPSVAVFQAKVMPERRDIRYTKFPQVSHTLLSLQF